jgi:ABC-type dipeptide/oligopeptide/nickel transport system permease component
MRWFPVSGGLDWSNPGALALRLALPVTVLALGQIASVARVTRTAVLEVLAEDYVRTARALGTPEMEVLFRHALRNALLPVMTVVGLSVGRLLGGTVIVESIFSIPGMGTALVQAIGARDYPIVQGLILVFALLFVLVNLFTDVLYTRLDPRVRLS